MLAVFVPMVVYMHLNEALVSLNLVISGEAEPPAPQEGLEKTTASGLVRLPCRIAEAVKVTVSPAKAVARFGVSVGVKSTISTLTGLELLSVSLDSPTERPVSATSSNSYELTPPCHE